MKTISLALLCAVVALAAASAQDAGTVHHLMPTPKTVVWGSFDARTPPVLRIRSGDTVELETLIAGDDVDRLRAAGISEDQIQPALHEIDKAIKERHGAHILDGPIFVEGAEPGDVLEVRIKSIEPAIPYAVNFVRPGKGLLPDEFPYARMKVTPLDLTRMVAKFADGIELPIRPFWGVMGVAPPPMSGLIGSGAPWVHAGNMDNKALVAGTILYLPVHAKGALFEVGDGHAGQGDGEVCVSALETSLKGTLQFVVRKDIKINWPRAETPDAYMTMGFNPSLEEATKIALREMIDYLTTQKHLSRDYAYILASDAVDFHIEEAVDGNLGVDAFLPKAIFVR